MQQNKSSEVLIVRNTLNNRLYDVVCVDFFNEDVEYVAKAIDFIEAVGIVEEMQPEEV